MTLTVPLEAAPASSALNVPSVALLILAIIDAYQRYDDKNAARRARTRSHNTARREYTS